MFRHFTYLYIFDVEKVLLHEDDIVTPHGATRLYFSNRRVARKEAFFLSVIEANETRLRTSFIISQLEVLSLTCKVEQHMLLIVRVWSHLN